MKAILSERGQVTIPHALREGMGLRPGTVLDFTLEQGRLVAVKEISSDPVAAVRGCLGRGGDSSAFLATLRGEA